MKIQFSYYRIWPIVDIQRGWFGSYEYFIGVGYVKVTRVIHLNRIIRYYQRRIEAALYRFAAWSSRRP